MFGRRLFYLAIEVVLPGRILSHLSTDCFYLAIEVVLPGRRLFYLAIEVVLPGLRLLYLAVYCLTCLQIVFTWLFKLFYVAVDFVW